MKLKDCSSSSFARTPSATIKSSTYSRSCFLSSKLIANDTANSIPRQAMKLLICANWSKPGKRSAIHKWQLLGPSKSKSRKTRRAFGQQSTPRAENMPNDLCKNTWAASGLRIWKALNSTSSQVILLLGKSFPTTKSSTEGGLKRSSCSKLLAITLMCFLRKHCRHKKWSGLLKIFTSWSKNEMI